MAYALYRNYRPKRFSDLIGQDDVAQTLRNQIAFGRVGHAYLFTGIRGTGKTTLARILSKAVNCLNPKDGEPCGECAICEGLDNGTILDVTEIDAASNNGVSNIRDLRDESAYVPTVAKYRVYIIDEVHMLSGSAFAALLKILEEPPEHVIFILATTEIHKVPATILSRCQRFDLKRISIKNIADYLMGIAKRTNIELEYDAATVIARHADGAMRDALSILDTCTSMGSSVHLDTVKRMFGSSESEYLFAISTAVANQDIKEVLNQIDILYNDSLNPLSITSELLSHYRNILVSIVASTNLLSDQEPEYVELYQKVSKLYNPAEIIRILTSLKDLSILLPSVVDKRLQLEISLVEICSGFTLQPVPLDKPAVKEQEVAKKQVTENVKAQQTVDIPVPKPEPPKESSSTQPITEIPTPNSVAEEEKKVIDETPRDDEFTEWGKVIAELEKSQPLIYGFLSGSRAYTTATHILIDCPSFAKTQIRDNKGYADRIKEAIVHATGVTLPIGPYNPPTEVTEDKEDSIEKLIKRATEIGIPVEVK